MPALADTLGQFAGAKLLTASYAQDLLDWSDGYRPGRGAPEAVRALPVDRHDGTYGSLVEADGHGFVDQRDHAWLLTMVRERMDDRALRRLRRQGRKAGLLETDGHVVHPETGSPQGGRLSPVLATGYVHDALEGWCAKVVQAHCRGEARRCRSAEDWGGALRSQADAERLYRV